MLRLRLHSLTKASDNNTAAIKITSLSVSLETMFVACFVAAAFWRGCGQIFGRPFVQELSSCWDGATDGHNSHGPKVGRGCCKGLDPYLTRCGLGRGLPLYQVASWSIQPFAHNCRNATLLRVEIRLRTIFIPSLVVKTFTGCVHW